MYQGNNLLQQMIRMDDEIALHQPSPNTTRVVPINKQISVHGLKTAQQWSKLHQFYVFKGLV